MEDIVSGGRVEPLRPPWVDLQGDAHELLLLRRRLPGPLKAAGKHKLLLLLQYRGVGRD